MMEISPALLGFGKLALAFSVMMALLRFRVGLWVAILAGSLAIAFTCGLSPLLWFKTAAEVLVHKEFVLLAVMLFFIMLLSSVQESTGQSKRLVEGIERYLRWPRIRLVIFPALVGLLPMPGGALFSCPMLKAAAKDISMTEEHKALINYWFRHIWEAAWPLYPGYILICSLLGIPLSRLWIYTFPLVFFSFVTGWFFYMRPLGRSRLLRNAADCALPGDAAQAEHAGKEAQAARCEEARNAPSLGAVLMEALPIAVTLLGAGVFALIIDVAAPALPSQFAFICSLFLAIGLALYQNRGRLSVPLPRLAFSRGMCRMVLLVYTIFIFKDVVGASGLVADIGAMGDSRTGIYLLFIILPLLCGILTGIMVGFVGACFPILIGVLEHMDMREEFLPLIVLAMVTGNCGQMLSPLHVCLVVSCEYFKVTFSGLLRYLIGPVTVQLFYGIAMAWALYMLGARV